MRSGLASRLLFFSPFSRSLAVCGRAAVTATLCALLVEQPVLAEAPAATTHKAPATTGNQIEGQERVLHALNRMTFGPRPGDAAAVAKMGVEKWFDEQLNPGRIDDSALDARLARYPATLLPLAELQKKYPSPGALRLIMDGKLAMPTDPTARAMVQDQVAFYAMAQEAKGKIGPGQVDAGINGQATPRNKNAVPATTASQGDDAQAMAAGDPQAATNAQAARRARRQQQQAGQAALNSPDTTGSTMGDGTGMMAEGQKPMAASDMTVEPMTGKGLVGGQRYPQDGVNRILEMAPVQRFAAILALPPRDLVRFRASLSPDQVSRLTDGLSPEQKEMLAALPGPLRMVGLEAMESRLDRDIYSDRQLEAVMTDFWLNHFNVYAAKNQNEPYLLPEYERETIRPHALGKFEDLLVATAESPAMLVYLDNFRSDGPNSARSLRIKKYESMPGAAARLKQASSGLNENYGRELMELHTLGVGGGYTQADVTNVSKVFTGWTIDKPYQGGGFVFDQSKHEPGSKAVLGKTIEYQAGQDGQKEGLEVLHMLATSPATAHFISTKLAVRFVSDDPPAALVDRMAGAFLKSGGDMKVVLKTMFDSPEFWSPAVYRAKVKTPLEFVASAVRAGDIQVERTQSLVAALNKLGMPLYGMQTPNGYSWKQSDWVSTGALVSRMNFSLVLSDDRIPGTRTEWTTLLGEGAGTSGVKPVSYSSSAGPSAAPEAAAVKEKRLEMILLGSPVSERTRATVLSQSADTSVAAQAETQFDLGGKGGGKGAKYVDRGLERDQKRLDRQGAGPDDPQAAMMAGLLLGSPEFQKR